MADAALLMGETLHRNNRMRFFGNSGSGGIAGLVAASMQLRLSALARTPRRAGGLVDFAMDGSAALAGEELDGFSSALRRMGRAGDCAWRCRPRVTRPTSWQRFAQLARPGW